MRGRIGLFWILIVAVVAIAPPNFAGALPTSGRLFQSAAATNGETVHWRGGRTAGLRPPIVSPYRYAYPYYPAPYFDTGPYYYPPPPGDVFAYCMARYGSFDPGTGSYIDGDGVRQLCP